jgi:hypothetical protein
MLVRSHASCASSSRSICATTSFAAALSKAMCRIVLVAYSGFAPVVFTMRFQSCASPLM